MVRVKICGLTNLDDALAAAENGADVLGFVFAESPRQVTPDAVRRIVEALPPFVLTAGVFVDSLPEQIRDIRQYCGLDAIQLHGSESEDIAASLGGRIIKTVKPVEGVGFSPDAYPGATLLFDTYCPEKTGGTGRTFHWPLAQEPARRRPIILAGGLTPDNIIDAIQTVRPYAVDVSSGVESEPGRKDHDKLACFIQRAKSVR